MLSTLRSNRPALTALLSLALAALFAVVYLGDLAGVPFHPDESGHIHMSKDFKTLFLDHDPLALAWWPDQPITSEVSLRLLDAPITRYLAGIGWWLRGFSVADLNSEWSWGAPWADNLPAIPSDGLLLAARTPVALLGAFTAVLLFWVGTKVAGLAVGLVAALLTGFDPLMLLYTRRVMGESSLMFFSVLALLGSLYLLQRLAVVPRPGWPVLGEGLLVGALAGLAMASKQTELVMLPVALLSAALPLIGRGWPLRRRLKALLLTWGAISLGSALVFLMLNPVMFASPLAVLRVMITQRMDLASSQVAVNGAPYPEMLLPDVPSRLAATVAQLYWQEPVLWDTPVYLDQLQPPAQQYLSVAWHTALRADLASILLVALSAIGIAASGVRLVRSSLDASTRPEQIVWFWTFSSLVLIALTIPLNWQRYFMPLLAPSRLFAAIGAVALMRAAWQQAALFASARAIHWSVRRS